MTLSAPKYVMTLSRSHTYRLYLFVSDVNEKTKDENKTSNSGVNLYVEKPPGSGTEGYRGPQDLYHVRGT